MGYQYFPSNYTPCPTALYPIQTPPYSGPVPNGSYRTAETQPPAPAPDERIWVQGEVAAASWPVTANGFVRLWDSTAHVFYEKRADAQGKPLPLEVYDYKRRGGDPVDPADATSYEDRLKSIEDRLAAIEDKRPAGKKKEDAQ